MKVFDVSFANDLCSGRQPVPVFAEDAASAVRIAVRAVNKRREQYVENVGPARKQFIEFNPIQDITAEEVVEVKIVRNQVAY